MNLIIMAIGIFLLVALLLPVLALCARAWKHGTHGLAANIAEGIHENGAITRRVDAALTDRHLLVKQGSDADHIAVNGAADIPLGTCPDEPEAAEDAATVNLLGQKPGTMKMVAGAAIVHGALVVGTASGKVITLPGTTGTYYIVGRSVNRATTADGDEIEVAHCFPTQRVVA